MSLHQNLFINHNAVCDGRAAALNKLNPLLLTRTHRNSIKQHKKLRHKPQFNVFEQLLSWESGREGSERSVLRGPGQKMLLNLVPLLA